MLGQAVRRFTTSAVRASHYGEGPGKGSNGDFYTVTHFYSLICLVFSSVRTLINLPFSVDNKWRLLGMMVVFFGSGFAVPFVVVRHQILKK